MDLLVRRHSPHVYILVFGMKEKRAVLDGIAAELLRIIGETTGKAIASSGLPLAA